MRIAVLLAFAFLSFPPAFADDIPMRVAVVGTLKLADGGNPDSFCGACTNHDDCGASDWRCCANGCSDGKMQCWKVASCDEISALAAPTRLAVSDR